MPSLRLRPTATITILLAGATLLTACGGGTEAAAREKGGATTAAAAAPTDGVREAEAGWPRVGSYGCTETITRMRNGSYEFEFEPRGLVVLEAGGRYTDPFGVKGSYRTLASGDSATFTGGLLDGATATPLADEDEPDRIRIEIPTENRSRRWSCGPKDGE